MSEIINPILRGFHPDASVIKVGTKYYLTVSTFEWIPGVDIYQSEDLVNWKYVSSPLKDGKQIHLKGNPASGSIWAPHLSYSNGKFYLVFTDVRTRNPIKDTLNFLIWTDDLSKEWSNPIFLNASGFDPSLFHDDDGSHYLINMLYDYRVDYQTFAGLVIQEIDLEEFRLIGERRLFFKGTSLGVCEGPQLMKKDGYYYLLSAAGGTGYSHAAVVCKSTTLFGDYELSPYTPLLSTKNDLLNPIQKAGHASFIEINNQWYIVHIMARPLTLPKGNCPLGRETGIQKIEWINGWPRLVNKTLKPEITVEKPFGLEEIAQRRDYSENIDFKNCTLPDTFKMLREDCSKELMFDSNKGTLRMYGRESLNSLHHQVLLARRWQHFHFVASTKLEFYPKNFQQTAGLVLYYDSENWQYLLMSYDENVKKNYLQVLICENNQLKNQSELVFIENNIPLLRVIVNYDKAQFQYSVDNLNWYNIGVETDADHLSDDYIRSFGKLPFTGAMVGICAQDLDCHQSFAEYYYFDYKEIH